MTFFPKYDPLLPLEVNMPTGKDSSLYILLIEFVKSMSASLSGNPFIEVISWECCKTEFDKKVLLSFHPSSSKTNSILSS